ncbi:TetR/AcrR family transcriptional regulator [Cognatishimia activa]|uniref:TetR/AcrR family transcriptional regulator n=1 Tax=Cognatishimia activa TaxID=1715691 RepID=UPI002231023D|nr:TetR/AcrR family transcriptional regulator [Cognatishimia activa]UZD90517.1 TetR/AcrR family transcriptional regulator [Cognatishimia activa]
MNTQAPILRKGRKIDQVLAGAREIFLRDGFEGASVDDIAKASGVSKATLYSYFSDKRQLFKEVVQAECERMSTEIVSRIDETMPVRDALHLAAYGLAKFLVSEFSQRIFRICVAERDRFPELGQAYYEAGPGNGHEQMVEHLRESVSRGELNIDDVDMAAYQFSELCKTKLFNLACFGVRTEFSDDEILSVANATVEMFMKSYGTSSPA